MRRVSAWKNAVAVLAMLGLIAPLALTAPPAARAAAGDVVVSSVNFDDSTTGTWSQSGSPTLSYVDNGTGKALSILRTNNWDGIASPTGLLQTGVTYTLSMKVKLSGDGPATSGVRFVVNHDSSAYDWVANGTASTTDWTTLSASYALSDGSDPATAKIYIGTDDTSPASAYTVLVDDVLVTAPAPVQTVSSVNFDDSTTGTWSQNGSPTLAYVDNGTGKALSITRTNNWDGIASPTGLLQTGVEYTISMKAKLAEGGPASTGVRFVVNHDSSAYDWVANTTINATDWTTVSGTYTLPDGSDPATAKVYLGSDDLSPAAPYTILVDDVLITAPAAPKTIASLNFDDSTTGDWGQNGSPTFGFVDDGKGGKALSVTRTNNWDGLASPTGLLLVGVEYTISMRAKIAAGGPATTGVRFVVNHDSSAYDWVANTSINATDWTVVKGTYTLPDGSDPSTAKIYVGSDDTTPAGPYTILLDDVLITAPAGSVPSGTGVLNSDCSGGYVALTYDDGPYAGQTSQLLTALDAAHLRATFFDWGQHISGNQALVSLQYANGWVGNHSWTHPDLTTLTQAQITTELTDTQNALKAITGADPVLFRPPYGATNSTLKSVEASLGLTEVIWDVDSQDWNGATTAQIVARVHSAQPGQVVLMHDNLATTRAAIPLIADDFSARKMCPGMINPATGKAVAPPAQTIVNSDFENGLDGWVARNSQGTPTVELTETEAHSPTHAVLVSNRAGQGDGVGHDMTGLMKPGTKYVITAWVKFAAGQPTDSLWLSMKRTTGTTDAYDTVAQFTNVSGDSWKQVTATYNMGTYDAGAFLYFETKYPDGTPAPFLIDDVRIDTQAGPVIQKDLTNLKDTVSFPVGVAIDSRETTGAYSELTLKHFSQITPENHMKPDAWYDADRNFRINPEAKALMDWAQTNDVRVWGHTLVWHQQTPAWFFQHDDGTALTSSDADKTILRNRLKTHIDSVAKTLHDMYGDFGSATNPLVGFDVVNEVISDGSTEPDGLRRSPWYNVLGPEYIDDAFNYAEQAFNVDYAAPGVTRPIKFAINDYNTEQAGKRARLHTLVADLLARHIPVDIVGHQFHSNLSANPQGFDDALTAFEDLPVKQDVSELDVMTGTPVDDAKLIDQGYFYRDAFRIFRKHAADLFSVTVWGLYDGRSWRSSDSPLLFNDALQAKPAFYGAIDTTLEPRMRSAFVFQGSVPLDASATTALEWQKLRLLTFGDADKVAFQLRWEPDHLTAFVSVKDATAQATDAIAFKLGDQTYAFKRDGTGDVSGVVSEVAGGWKGVVSLPLSGAKLNDQLKFDVAVTDGADTIAWNDPGATGTLSLVEPVSYTDIMETATAPTIDGDVDAAWARANTVSTDKQITGTAGATATVKTLWKDGTLYVLMQVTDPVLDDTASDPWQKDSVEIYVDGGNFKNGAYRPDDTQIRINYKNQTSFGTGDEAAQQARLVSATKVVDGGYVVEAAIDLLSYGGAGTFQGLDFQVNDASNGARTGIRNWADPTNAGYQSTSRWGVGQLVARDKTVPQLHLTTPLYLTATADDGYHGFTQAIAGVTATDAFDAASALTITGNAPAVLPIGTTVVTWTVTDPAGNSSTAQQSVVVARRVPTRLTYVGERAEVVSKVSTFKAATLLTSSNLKCIAGQTLTYAFDRDPVTGAAGAKVLGTATTNKLGIGMLSVSSAAWKPGKYTLTVTYDGNNKGCLASTTTATITVMVAGPKHRGDEPAATPAPTAAVLDTLAAADRRVALF